MKQQIDITSFILWHFLEFHFVAGHERQVPSYCIHIKHTYVAFYVECFVTYFTHRNSSFLTLKSYGFNLNNAPTFANIREIDHFLCTKF
jgi:hypothetical protein